MKIFLSILIIQLFIATGFSQEKNVLPRNETIQDPSLAGPRLFLFKDKSNLWKISAFVAGD